MKGWLNRLFAAIDRMDSDSFVLFLTEEASFRFANGPAVFDRENIRNAVQGFFSSIKGLRHNVSEVWEHGNIVICEGEATYTRHDGQKLTLPFVNILRMEDELIADYRIYIDISPLYA